MIKILKNQKGELLIESIVSFVILIIALTIVTAIVLKSQDMNLKANQKVSDIETAITKIEKGEAKTNETLEVVNINVQGKTFSQKVRVGNENSIDFFLAE
ncbi:MAG: hypothetical protein RR967_02390 [Anaerovoracaceae bacterium]